MTELVTLEQFKEHARILHDDEDGDIERKLEAVNAYVLGYLPQPIAEDWSPPEDLRQAALLILTHWFENRESTATGTLFDIPIGATDIIANYREWVF